MDKNSPSRPWSILLAVHDVPAEGQHFDLVADAPTRVAVAQLAGVLGIGRLEAHFDALPWRGDGLRLSGEVSAAVEQRCVVTLEPVQGDITEPVGLTFLPPGAAAPAGAAAGEGFADGEDEPEAVVDGSIDLGAIATEFLLLGINPYPRKPGADFTPPSIEEHVNNPFGVLSALKTSPDGG